MVYSKYSFTWWRLNHSCARVCASARLKCYNPENRHERTETERFKPYIYKELTQRDKANLDIIWIKDESLEELENLPEPEILAAEIIENLEDALEQFRSIQDILEEE